MCGKIGAYNETIVLKEMPDARRLSFAPPGVTIGGLVRVSQSSSVVKVRYGIKRAATLGGGGRLFYWVNSVERLGIIGVWVGIGGGSPIAHLGIWWYSRGHGHTPLNAYMAAP